VTLDAKVKQDDKEGGTLIIMRRDDPIDLTTEEIAYSSDFAKALERRLSLVSSQSTKDK
jgi:hypothetical protein